MAVPTVPLDSLRFIGHGLNRPECVLATVRGDLYTADWRGGVAQVAGRVLKNVSSLAFGGPGLRTAYLGCLLGDSIAAFESPVAGHLPAHWNWC